MAATKKSVIETLANVKNLGPAYAEAAYDDLGVRSLDDLIAAAQDKKLQTIKGVGAAKEKSILKSALELKNAAGKAAEVVEAPKAPAKAKAKGITAQALWNTAATPTPTQAATMPSPAKTRAWETT